MEAGLDWAVSSLPLGRRFGLFEFVDMISSDGTSEGSQNYRRRTTAMKSVRPLFLRRLVVFADVLGRFFRGTLDGLSGLGRFLAKSLVDSLDVLVERQRGGIELFQGRNGRLRQLAEGDQTVNGGQHHLGILVTQQADQLVHERTAVF